MNTSQLSSYAPEARKAFSAAVSSQAARYGITAKGNLEGKVEGDVFLMGGQAFPRADAHAREALVERVQTHGFAHTMEVVAYTWFNRLVAIRYMELHGYLDHGYRVLSHPDGHARPEILDRVADVDLPGLDKQQAVELKLDGTKDEELYRLLLKAQCNALHAAMPFLFDEIGGADELLLPPNLLHTDSLVRQLVERIDEALWQEIEIIGWLYQFYISEKKDQVIGKVVKSEDIPAATQLFTPSWIVKYMVQNSLGAQWVATYPQSPLKGQMDYYIEPAKQTDEVKAQLAVITPSQLNPEEITLIDPASGSGHILVEGYELFKAIYLERGYRQRDVARLILEKNLFGLDIDERAAQLTGFALMMKGRADDRRLFERGVTLNVMALVDSAGFDAEALAKELRAKGRVELIPSNELFPETRVQPTLAVSTHDELEIDALRDLKRLFEHATTFGSLIQVPDGLATKLPVLKKLSEATSRDLFVSDALKRLGPLVRQAELLAAQYDSVVANPPYMGSGGMNALMKRLAKDHFPDASSDLFACFIERGYTFATAAGRCSMITMQSWMFLSSFEGMRERMLRVKTITTMAQIGYNSFPSMNSKVAQATMFSITNQRCGNFVAAFIDLNSAPQSADKRSVFLARDPANRFEIAADEFAKIQGSPLAYWLSDHMRQLFVAHEERLKTNSGLTTGDNERFLRFWWDISVGLLGLGMRSRVESLSAPAKWYPYNKGGNYRRWYGNNELVVNWYQDGREIQATGRCVLRSKDDYFRPGVTWGGLTSSAVSFRFSQAGHLFDSNKGPMIFGTEDHLRYRLGLLNSVFSHEVLQSLNPTLSTQTGDIERIPAPYLLSIRDGVQGGVQDLVEIARSDWNAYERSWDFQSLPLLTASSEPTSTLESSYTAWVTQNRDSIAEMKRLEEENNRLFIDAYGLADELTPDVPIEQITLTVNPAYRYGGKLTAEEQWTRFRQDTMEELVSYAIGCMMGRYSLDAPGLIYAHSGNEGFDENRYKTFPADDDGIVPLTDTEWFDDDACNRLVEFVSQAWDGSHLEDNLSFLANNLSPKRGESSRDTIRRYLCDKFFKDHQQTYKKRPIYWLFSSGKKKAFQCLVYLHRYNEGTLSRMRSEYVIPLQGKMAARIEQLQADIHAATSTAQSKRFERERATLEKQQVELLAYDEKLRHYADRRITLGLDDGVKVNYGKFGDLLAEVKAIHGAKAVEA